MRLAGLILAGGLSSRMGGSDKAFARLAGEPLLAHARRRMTQAGATPLALSSNADPECFAGSGLTILPDHFPHRPGPLAGIHAGLRWAASLGAARLFTAPVDTVFLPADTLSRLAAAAPDTIAVAASGGRCHPVVAVWPTALADALERHLGSGGSLRVNHFIDAHGRLEVDFADAGSGGPDPFFNINTPADLAEAERWLPERRS